jgi:Flp pilus assembly protein TadD
VGTERVSENRLDEAIRDFRASLHFAPDDADAYNNLGGALARKGEWTQAADALERALEIKPDHAQARNNLRLVRAELARYGSL